MVNETVALVMMLTVIAGAVVVAIGHAQLQKYNRRDKLDKELWAGYLRDREKTISALHRQIEQFQNERNSAQTTTEHYRRENITMRQQLIKSKRLEPVAKAIRKRAITL